MSNSVVPAAAVAHAKQLVRNKKLTKHTQNQKHAQDEQLASDRQPDEADAVQARQAEHARSSMSEHSLSGDFSFSGVLAEAADSSVSVTAAASGDGAYADDDGGAGSTILLVGAVALVGLGVAVAAGGGKSNDPPTVSAATQTVTTDEDVAKAVTVSATDPDGDPLTYSVTTNPAKGAVTGGTNGAFTYTPNANANGTDSFVVTVSDGKGGTVTQTVNVTINPVNDAPTAAATQAVSTDEDVAKAFTVAGTDVDGDPLTYTVSTQPGKGTVTGGAGGAFTYTPNADANGTDSLVVTISDGKGGTTTQTVNITINPVNDDPTVAATQAVATDEDVAKTVTVAGNDVDGDDLTYTVTENPTHGTVTGGIGGVFTYTPAANYNGTDHFIVSVSDGKGGVAAQQTVNVTVNPVNDAPHKMDDTTDELTIAEDTTGTIIIDFDDVDGDDLTLTVINGPAHGTLSNSLVYTPNANFNGTDSITFNVSDGNGGNTPHTVAITVTPVNDAPTFPADAVTVNAKQDTTLNGTLTAADVDGDALAFGRIAQATHGTATVNADGTWTYAPNAGYTGTDVFTVGVSDGNGGSDTMVVNVVVAPGQTTVSLDQGQSSKDPVTIDAGGGSFIFTDNPAAETNVRIVNFGADDQIRVSGGLNPGDYSYNGAGDLFITYNDTGPNLILLVDVLAGPVFNSYSGAVASIQDNFDSNFTFMTFG